MHCTSCNRFLGDKVKTCDYCGAKQKRRPAATPLRDELPAAPSRVPYMPSRTPQVPLPPSQTQVPSTSTTRLAVVIICVVLGMIVFPAVIVMMNERAVQHPTVPHTRVTTQYFDSWADGDDPWGFRATTSQQLLDDPDSYDFRRVSVIAAANRYTHHEADTEVYSVFHIRAGYVLYAEDETGPLLLFISEDHADQGDWRSGELRFDGRFWGLQEVEGEQTPIIDVEDWEIAS